MLVGELCNVRHMTLGDLDEFIRLLNDVGGRGPFISQQFRSPEGLKREFAATAFVTDEREQMLVEDKQGRLIGLVQHFASRTPLTREIAYRRLAPAGAKGAMSEATQLLCDYLFRAYQYHRLELIMNPANMASERIAQRCGFTYEATLRGLFYSDGAVGDVKMYSLLRPEWAAHSSR